MENLMIINVEVCANNGLEFEKVLKRFNKKVKKSDILREHVEKTLFFMTKSQKRRTKRMRNRFLRAKFENDQRYRE